MKTIVTSLLLIFTTTVVLAQWAPLGNPGISTGFGLDNKLAFTSNGDAYLLHANSLFNATITVERFDGTSWTTLGGTFLSNNANKATLEIGPGDIPYVAFRDENNGNKATVAYFQGGNWNYLGGQGFTATSANRIDLTFDDNDIPYIIYDDAFTQTGIYIEKYENNSWVQVPVPAGISGHNNEIIFALGTNTPVITATDAGVLKVYGGDGAGGWVLMSQTPSWTNTNAFETQLELFAGVLPVIAYSTSGSIGMQVFNGTTWSDISPPSTSITSLFFDMVIDQNDEIYLGYGDTTQNNKMTVLQYNAGAWNFVGPQGFTPDSGTNNGLAISPSNQLHAAFADGTVGSQNSVYSYTTQQTTFVPDDDFETYLIANGFDSGPLDDMVLTSNIDVITNLDLTAEPIADFTGIEDFAALTSLLIGNASTTSFDVTSNVALEQFGLVNTTAITTVDASTLSNLEILFLDNNSALNVIDIDTAGALLGLISTNNPNVTGIDISNNLLLDELTMINNGLTAIDLSANTMLTSIALTGNQLTAIDVSNQPNLSSLNCDNNLITALNLTANTNLNKVVANDNALTNMDVRNGNNTLITIFNILNNPALICVSVDDIAFSDTNWTNKDTQTAYSLDCTLGITNHNTITITIFPNPTSEIVTIQNLVSGDATFRITNVQGKVVKSGIASDNQIDVSMMSSGLYFLTISEENKSSTLKFIKN